jgi:hypothetical protein
MGLMGIQQQGRLARRTHEAKLCIIQESPKWDEEKLVSPTDAVAGHPSPSPIAIAAVPSIPS